MSSNPIRKGLYARFFHQEDLAELRRMDPDDIRHEINALRVTASRILEQLEGDPEPDRQIKLWGTLFGAMSRISASVRTYKITISGKNPEVIDAIEEGLRMFREEEGL
jgi:hypothetical protein